MALFPSVCVYVCQSLSQVDVLSNSQIGQDSFWHRGFLRIIEHYVVRKSSYLYMRELSYGILSETLNLEKLRHGTLTIASVVNLVIASHTEHHTFVYNMVGMMQCIMWVFLQCSEFSSVL